MMQTVSEKVAPRVVGIGLALIAVAIIGTTAPHQRRNMAKPPWHPPRVSTAPPNSKPSKSPRPRRPADQKTHYGPEHRYISDPSGRVPVTFNPRDPVVKRPSSPSHQPTTRPTSPPTRPAKCIIGAKVLTISVCLHN